MRIGFSPKAERDLEEIGDYIARDNPARAITFLDELRASCLEIAARPGSYPVRPELGEGIRRAVYGRYLIFYSAGVGALRIERILHGARNLERVSR